jgi:hypothetical protein
MKLAAVLLFTYLLRAQQPPSAETPRPQPEKEPIVKNNGKPMTVPFACTEDDMTWAGMSCSEEQPCPVYLELTALEAVGNRLIVLANIHSESQTLYSELLESEDGGATWQEPYARMRGTGLDHVQFIDFQNGWISGEVLVPVSHDPFLLISSDGGKSWRQRGVFGEGGDGAIRQFHFESAANGSMVIDRMDSESSRYVLYQTPNGGETWLVLRTSDRPITIPGAGVETGASGWRIRADARSKSFAVERRQEERWTTAASFLVEIGSCKPAPRPAPAPPEAEPAAPAEPAKPPTLKPPRRQP